MDIQPSLGDAIAMETEDEPSCFLCSPDPALVFLRGDRFFAMLGHGPLGVGYSLIATQAHCPSMLDLEASAVAALAAFTREVRAVIAEHWPGGAAIGEHGRVAACVSPAAARYEPHCLHAHRLVFPGIDDIDLTVVAPVSRFASFADAYASSGAVLGQYLYSERSDGSCQIAPYSRSLPRQTIRRIVADRRGEPGLADWRSNPRLDVVAAAQLALGVVPAERVDA